MTNIITIEELKNSVLNANVDDEYIQPALTEAQDIYLREILGDKLYDTILGMIDAETLAGKYQTLVDQYIKPYLTYEIQALICVPINFKIRNAGVINQYGQDFNTSGMKDTEYLKSYYDNKAEFYAGRMVRYLTANAADITEYAVSDENITNPTDAPKTGCSIFLGGRRG